MKKFPRVPLTGQRLLRKVKNLPHLSKLEKAKACGYYHVTKRGNVRVDLKSFLEALLSATAPEIALEALPEGQPRRLAYMVKVNQAGQIVIGSAYTRLMDLAPGDEFEIKLGKNRIRLVHIVRENDITTANETIPLAA